MTKQDYDIITLEKWECPEDNDARILTQPNLPRPLHSMAPRTVLDRSTWEHMRKACYAEADYTCEVCGYKPTYENGDYCHAHELYTIDYAKQESTFVRCVCLCKRTHLMCIHTGRALTLYKQGNPLYTAEKLLEGAEHAFIIINRWNREHPDAEPLRVYQTWLEYLKAPELHDRMDELIKKYDIKFYKVSDKWENKKRWPNWKLKVGTKWYPTPYENWEAWEEAMANNSKRKDDDHGVKNPFSGDVYDEIKKLLT